MPFSAEGVNRAKATQNCGGFCTEGQTATAQGHHADAAWRARFAKASQAKDASPHLLHQALLDAQPGRANPLGEPLLGLSALSPCSVAAEPVNQGCKLDLRVLECLSATASRSLHARGSAGASPSKGYITHCLMLSVGGRRASGADEHGMFVIWPSCAPSRTRSFGNFPSS